MAKRLRGWGVARLRPSMRFWRRRQRSDRRSRLRRLITPTTLSIVTIAWAVGLFWVGAPVLDVIELNLLDLRFRARGPIKPLPTVVLATIDERNLAGRFVSHDGAVTLNDSWSARAPEQVAA